MAIPTVEADLFSYLSARGDTPSLVSLPDDLRDSVERYLHNYDIVALRQLTTQRSRSHFTRVVDYNSGQSFLLIAPHRGAVPYVVNLTGWLGGRQRIMVVDALTRERVQDFVDSRARWLEVRGAP